MQQSQQKLCTVHQELIVQKNDNDKVQCQTCMKIQYKNEITEVEEAVKEQQMTFENQKLDKEYHETTFNESIIKYSQQKLREFNYQLIKQYPHNYYRSFVFNQDSTVLFAKEYQVIKLLQFKNGKKLLQKLTKYPNNSFRLFFLNKSNSLIFQGDDKSIIIWNWNYNNDQKKHQKLKGHKDQVNIMINNDDEDLLISGGGDKTIKFWRKTNMNWSCQQTIQTQFYVLSLSLNKSQTKLISCGWLPQILVMELNSAQWYIKQTIQLNCYGRQLCFISDSKFLFQGDQECLEIYEYQQIDRQFIKETTVEVQKQQSFDNFGYPCKYLESKSFAIVQYGKYLNFFGVGENQNFELSYSIDFHNKYFIGNISNDGQYLVTRNDNYLMEVRKFKYLE